MAPTICEHIGGCETIASFGFPHVRHPRRTSCEEHKKEGMCNLTILCEFQGCLKQPIFGFPKGRARFCGDHKEPNMVDTHHRLCVYADEHGVCRKQPTHACRGEKARFCAEHAKLQDGPGMENVVSPRCQMSGCERLNPSFNYPGETRGIYCSQCARNKHPDMVNVKHSKCEYRDAGPDGAACTTVSPDYNFPEFTTGRYCALHYKEGMISMKKRRRESHHDVAT